MSRGREEAVAWRDHTGRRTCRLAVRWRQVVAWEVPNCLDRSGSPCLVLGAALALGSLATPTPATANAPSISEARNGQADSSDDPAQGAAAVAKSWQIKYRFSTRWGKVNLLYDNSKYGYRHIKQRRVWSDKGMNRFIRRVFRRGAFCEDPPRCTYLQLAFVRNVTRARATQDIVVVRNVLHHRAPRRIGIITAYSRRPYFPQGGGGCTRICYP